MNTNTDDCLDIVPLLDRLMEAPRHKDIYQALDGAWIDTEGKLRMLTALASGLLMLLEKGLASQNHQNVDSGCDWSEWFVFLDELTLYLLGCCGSYTHPSPQFHQKNAQFARARFVSLRNGGDDKKEEHELLNSIYRWTVNEQLAAKKKDSMIRWILMCGLRWGYLLDMLDYSCLP